VPLGKVKWYDAEKGFGFLSDDDGTDVFLHADALPAGVTTLKGGTRVEFGVVEGRRGAQALSLRVLDPAPSVVASVAAKNRTSPEAMTVIVEDVIKLLDSVVHHASPRQVPGQGIGGQGRQGAARDRGPARDRRLRR